MSLPHFYKGDPKVVENIEGLKPNPIKHQSYINVNPRLGFAMSGFSRTQINIQVKKSFGFNQLNMFKNDVMLPVAWFDIVSLKTKPYETYKTNSVFICLTGCRRRRNAKRSLRFYVQCHLTRRRFGTFIQIRFLIDNNSNLRSINDCNQIEIQSQNKQHVRKNAIRTTKINCIKYKAKT